MELISKPHQLPHPPATSVIPSTGSLSYIGDTRSSTSMLPSPQALASHTLPCCSSQTLEAALRPNCTLCGHRQLNAWLQRGGRKDGEARKDGEEPYWFLIPGRLRRDNGKERCEHLWVGPYVHGHCHHRQCSEFKSSFTLLPPSLSPLLPQSETCLLSKVPLSNEQGMSSKFI